MKRILSLILSLALIFALAVPALADKASAAEKAKARADQLADDQKTLNIFTWTYYVPDEVVSEFEQATGIRVNYSAMLGNEDVLPKLSAGGAQYDIVVCSDYIIGDLAAMDLLTKIDRTKIATYENIAPAYQGQYYDPADEYSIPYTNTVPLIVYNPSKVDFEVEGFADLWRDAFKGGLALVSEWRGVIGMAQKKLGYSYNDTDPGHIQEVGEELKKLKDNICVMTDDVPHNALISGDAIAGFMYGSQIVAARELVPELKVVYPGEGLGFGIDCLVMPKDAPHSQAAYIFLEYLLDGEVSAYASELIQYGNCNSAAREFMSEEYVNNDTVNIPAEKVATAEMMRPLTNDVLALYDQIWTAFMQ